jgi:hypothetical protein
VLALISAVQQGDRKGALPHHEHRQDPHQPPLPQAGGAQPHPGGGPRQGDEPPLARPHRTVRKPGQASGREGATGPVRASLRRSASLFHGDPCRDAQASPKTTFTLSIIPAFSCSRMWQWNM